MVTKKQRNGNANQHDKRHENGLAAPGKRITKEKSNPQLNGHVNGAPHPTSPPLLANGAVDHGMTTHPANTQAQDHVQGPRVHAQSQMVGSASTCPIKERVRAGSEVSLDGLEACRGQYSNGNINNAPVSHLLDPAPHTSLRRNDASGHKTPPMFKASMLTVVTTILSSCPLRDVLAILILLLQLPPTVLTIVQFLFATLTFVPPQAGSPLSALSAFPSFTDIFQGSGGTPSVFTIVFADVFILLTWLLLWVPVQNFLLDLAQAVIAIALGGAAAGKSGTTNSIFICFVIILSNHLFRFRPLRQHILHFLWTGLARGGLDFLTSPPSTPSYLESFSTPHGWPRTILGVHILAQGVVRIIRRSLSRREAAHTLPTGKKTDPEAGVHLHRTNSVNLDANVELPSSSSTDGRPLGPSPAAHLSKDKASSSRKKRKQATHVRSQQPFWAALASTKVTVLKEMESSRAANDAGEANAKDANHIGNAVWRSEDDRVWISEVGHSDVSFRVSLFSDEESAAAELGQNGSTGSGIDRSKPFYIRVNGADWSSTRIRQISSDGYGGEEGTGFWGGEIFGLNPLSNYYCEFVRTTDHEAFYSTSLITSTGPVAEQASIASPLPHQTLRPASPATTLKNSIAAADQKLQDQRNRLKRNRKDHKTSISAVKKEVDTLSTRLANAGGSDERQRQRVLQFTQNIRQAEDATVDLSQQVDALGDIPEDDAAEAATMKREWRKERDNKNAVSAEFDSVKCEVDRQANSVESDIAAVIQKRERLQQRQTRLNEQHDRLITANKEGFSAKQRKEQERLVHIQDRINAENQYRSNINSFERRTTENSLSTAQIIQTIQHYEILLLQQSQLSSHSVPTTPEGPLPGTSSMSPHANAFTSFSFPNMAGHMTPSSMHGGRGRSSSMLSNISGFTDEFHDMASPSNVLISNQFNLQNMLNGRKGSNGSGSLSSGTSSQSSSQRDPMSPPPKVRPLMARHPTNLSNGLASPISGW
ncbi:ubiquitination network signaling protein [Pleomassaria siparia CBS 279.74]|uniref:Ubiquitination network signaling protein n=1 Tax=Pleomassaria siparia CBS 279.74 TaxID=1314801 RepID=A0A6G1JUF5_9PLEO|nr:ubiquitination network signaling protein [Pleomassaria siparia CBS 279.74]